MDQSFNCIHEYGCRLKRGKLVQPHAIHKKGGKETNEKQAFLQMIQSNKIQNRHHQD